MIASQRQPMRPPRAPSQTTGLRPVLSVLSEEEFLQALARERLQTDRRRRCTLAVFRLPAGGLRPATDSQVLGIVARHAGRAADIGSLGRSGIGVLLRQSEPGEVGAFCVRVAAELAQIGAEAAWRVIRRPAGAPARAHAWNELRTIGVCPSSGNPGDIYPRPQLAGPYFRTVRMPIAWSDNRS